MRRSHPGVAGLALLLLWATPAAGQLVGQAAEARAQARARALVGDTGLPKPPPLVASSPRHLMLFEDRRFVNQEKSGPADGGPVLVSHVIPAGVGGTGTTIAELLWYQLPTNYVGNNDARPLVIAYHGYGASAESVADQTTIDEECEARGWIYMAPTGLDDQVYGSLFCQQHIEVAIDWMSSNFLIDPDRIYMVGFSMGGCVVTSFSNRHRDPAGIMIAATASVSGAFDITLTYKFTNAFGKQIMEHPLSFGGTPTAFPFRYQQCSSLYATPSSYPPTPGTNDPSLSMGDNLHNTPLYLTWDSGDPLIEKPHLMGPQLATLVTNAGGSVQAVEVSGTVDPITQLPAPHSWAVLNETEVFDFFADKTVLRTPATVHAQCDRNETVSWTTNLQANSSRFTFVEGASTAGVAAVTGVINASLVSLDVTAAGQAGIWPLRVVAGSADTGGFTLRLSGFDQPPSYLLRTADGSLVTGVESDPTTNSLVVKVPGLSTLDVNVVSEPWLAKLSTTPEPAAVGGGLTLNFDAPSGNSPPTCLLIYSLAELLTPVKGGNVITANLLQGVLLPPLPLDGNGDFVLNGTLSNEPSLSGLRIVFQGIAITPSGDVDSISNLWDMDIQ